MNDITLCSQIIANNLKVYDITRFQIFCFNFCSFRQLLTCSHHREVPSNSFVIHKLNFLLILCPDGWFVCVTICVFINVL